MKLIKGMTFAAGCALLVSTTYGCSSTTTIVDDTDSGSTVRDSGTKDTSTVVKDSGNTSGDSATDTPPACYTDGDAISLIGFTTGPVAHQGKCSTPQITAFMTACFGSGTDASDCDAWVTANATCDACLNGTPADAGMGPTPVLIPIGDQGSNFVTADVEGCIAALSAGDAACKQNFEALETCAISTCSGIDSQGNDLCASDATYTACVNYALTDASSSCLSGTIPVPDATCTAALGAVSASDKSTKCGSGSTGGFAAVFPIVAGTLCGQ